MADILLAQTESVPVTMRSRYRDMGDGTHALVTAPGAAAGVPLPVDLLRGSAVVTVRIALGESLSETIDFRDYSLMVVVMPALWTAARLAVQVAVVPGGPYLVLYDDMGGQSRFNGGTNVQVNRAYVAPAEIAGVHYIRLWSENGAGVGVNQAGNRSFRCLLKA